MRGWSRWWTTYVPRGWTTWVCSPSRYWTRPGLTPAAGPRGKRELVKEQSYVNGSWWKRRPEIRYQHDAHDRRVAGADHHLHGDHTADAEGAGGARASTATARSEGDGLGSANGRHLDRFRSQDDDQRR